MRFSVSLAALTLIFLIPFSAHGMAQLQVDMGSAEGSPQSEVTLQLSLSGSPQVGSVTLSITFPKDLLSFIMARSKLVEAAGANISAETKPHPYDARKEILEVTLSTIGSGGTRTVLPEGPLGEVIFVISVTAEPETEIALETKASALTVDDPPKLLDSVKTANGKISVVPSLIFSCFFYMH